MAYRTKIIETTWRGLGGVACLGACIALAGCASGDTKEDEEVKEQALNTEEMSEEQLAAFISQGGFNLFGGEATGRYVELDGKAPRELLVEVRCGGDACSGDHYEIRGSLYFLYDLSTSLDDPEMWTAKPISVGPGGDVQIADLNGDGKDDLLLSGTTKTYGRSLKVYSVMGRLLSTRFEGELPAGTIAQQVIDLDEDGTVELVTIQRNDAAANTDPYAYNYNYESSSLLPVGLLGNLTVQPWSVARGSLNKKKLEAGKIGGLQSYHQRLLSEEEVDLSQLAKVTVMLRALDETATLSDTTRKAMMERYDTLIANGEELAVRQQAESYNGGYPQYDSYGNIITPEPERAPSFEPYLLLSALYGQESEELRVWARKKLDESVDLDAFAVYLDLMINATGESTRNSTLIALFEESLDTLLTEGPNSSNFYNLAYVDPYNGAALDDVQKSFFIASYMIDDEVTFEGKEAAIRSFLLKGAKSPQMPLTTLLGQAPFIYHMGPYVLEMDLGKLPADLVVTLFNQVLPNYITTMQNQEGGFGKEERTKLIDAVSKFMKVNPGRQGEVMYFITNYLPDPAFGPIVAPNLSRLRDVFESGRATQDDRNNMYNAASMLPMAMNSLSKSDREWWLSYVYRQGMGYTVDATLAAGCYDLPNQTDEQLEAIFSALETLPKESTLASTCLPYMLGVYDGGSSPLPEAFEDRLPDVIAKRLKTMDDEHQLQQLLTSLEPYAKLEELDKELWRVVKRRKNTLDTARFQALIMLAKIGDAKAKRSLEAASKAAFTDSSARRKIPYFNEYFYVDALARQQGEFFVSLMMDMATRKDVVATSCQLLRDYITSYNHTIMFDETEQKRYDSLCTGS